VTALECQKATDQLRCPLCHKDITAVLDEDGTRNDEKTWRQHLVVQQCTSAIVRISTNVKPKISIHKKLAPPNKVIMEEDEDEEEGNKTVGGQEEDSPMEEKEEPIQLESAVKPDD